ncbi:hypothetical protein OGZ39_12340 [Lactococcus lactis]|uniref:Uncharacterized protein n=1 Tax=Lactococcus lactis TaxID=1358 RepID=A0A9X4NET9_9LACT|nr:hypothetical protein [Lactococcus lactis]MDG4982424.1 hypothetical protein [Lactococcus lactis]
MINEKNQNQNIFEKIVLLLFFLFNLLSIISISSFSTFYTYLSAKSHTLMFIALFIFILGFFAIRTLRQFIVASLFLLAIFINYYFIKQLNSNIIVWLFILYGVSAYGMRLKRLIKLHFFALVTAMIAVIGMSLIGMLPRSGQVSSVLFSNYQNTVYFYGFNHPNMFGMLLVVLGIEAIVVNLMKKQRNNFIFLVVAIIFSAIIGAGTATMGGIIFIISYFVIKLIENKNWYKILSLTAFIPIILASFAFWITTQLGTPLFNFINGHVQSRPALWTYYLQNFPIKNFGTNVMTSTTIGLSTYGNGILDGAYIFLTMFFGRFALVLFILSLIVLLREGMNLKEKLYFSAFIAFSFMAFPEDQSAMIYINVFLIVLGYYQFSKKERMNLLQLRGDTDGKK